MRLTSFILVCLSTIVLASFLGCATLGGGQVSGINWALEKNGGRVTVFSEDPDYPAAKLIDGVTSSEGWSQGEGWQAPITLASSSRSRDARRNELQNNWIEIELANPAVVNHVVIHTVDSEEFPARDFGVSDLLVQYETETALKDKIWVNAERYGKGVGERDNIIRDKVRGVIDVRFKPATTIRIKVLIIRTNDLKQVEGAGKTKEGIARLTEIQVFGTGSIEGRDELDVMFQE